MAKNYPENPRKRDRDPDAYWTNAAYKRLAPKAAIRGARKERKPFGNPNSGKQSAGRLKQRQNPSRVRASKVTTRYMPGKTVAARIAGINAYYERERELARIGA